MRLAHHIHYSELCPSDFFLRLSELCKYPYQWNLKLFLDIFSHSTIVRGNLIEALTYAIYIKSTATSQKTFSASAWQFIDYLLFYCTVAVYDIHGVYKYYILEACSRVSIGWSRKQNHLLSHFRHAPLHRYCTGNRGKRQTLLITFNMACNYSYAINNK